MINVWESTCTWLCKQTSKCCQINTNSSLREGAAPSLRHHAQSNTHFWTALNNLRCNPIKMGERNAGKIHINVISNCFHAIRRRFYWGLLYFSGLSKTRFDWIITHNNLYVPSSLLVGLLYSGCIWSASRLRGRARWLRERERRRGWNDREMRKACIRSYRV